MFFPCFNSHWNALIDVWFRDHHRETAARQLILHEKCRLEQTKPNAKWRSTGGYVNDVRVCVCMTATACHCVCSNLCGHHCCAFIMIFAWHIWYLHCAVLFHEDQKPCCNLKLPEHCVRINYCKWQRWYQVSVDVILVALINHWGNEGERPTEGVTVQTLSVPLRRLQTSARRNSLNPNFQLFQLI